MNKEATARIKINKLLEESGWVLAGNNSNVTLESNIKDLEVRNHLNFCVNLI